MSQHGGHLYSCTELEEPESLFYPHEADEQWRLRLGRDEAAGLVERSIPRYVDVGAERDLGVPAAAGFRKCTLDELTPDAASTERGKYRKLFEVRVPVEIEDMYEPDDHRGGCRVS